MSAYRLPALTQVISKAAGHVLVPVHYLGAVWGAMAVIIEYTDMLGAKHLGLQNMPLPDLVKYCVLGVSGLLLLLAIAIFLWQIFRCCAQTNDTQDTSRYLHIAGLLQGAKHTPR